MSNFPDNMDWKAFDAAYGDPGPPSMRERLNEFARAEARKFIDTVKAGYVEQLCDGYKHEFAEREMDFELLVQLIEDACWAVVRSAEMED